MPPDFLVFAFRRLSKVLSIASRGLLHTKKGEPEKLSLCRCRSCRATGLGDIPTPPRAMTKLFDATDSASFAGHLEKTGEAVRATIPASAATPTA
jgi:hypothetical protein